MEIVSGRWRDLEHARLVLARFPRRTEALNLTLQRLASFARSMLGVDRVSIWDVDASGDRLVRRAVADDRSEAVRELPLADATAYATVLTTRRVVAVENVETDSFTAPLLEVYCRPLQITSMMDVPVYSGGDFVGVVCHERRGKPRPWSDMEAELGVHIAEVVSALRTEHAARDAEHFFRRLEVDYAELLGRAALGRAARGIAHDLTSLFGAVGSAATILERKGDEPQTRTEIIQHLKDVVHSAQRLCEELQRPHASSPLPDPIGLDTTLGELKGTLSALSGNHGTLELQPGSNGALVRIAPSALEQILMNLVVNAREARSDTPIVIRSYRVPPGPESIRPTALIEVEDHGPGISSSDKEKVFKADFSTKGSSRGLGLFTVQRLVEAAGGWIDIQSEAGHGTRFRVHLPSE